MFSVKPFQDTDKKQYQDFIVQPVYKPHVSFMHTWEWGDVMQQESHGFERFGVYDGPKLVAVGQASKRPLRLGGFYWYCPRGLVLDYTKPQTIEAAYHALRDHFATTGAAFLKVDPDVLKGSEAEAAIDTLHPQKAAIFTQVERAWLADIQKTEAEQFAWLKAHGMDKNVPYYYRKSLREGVTVRASTDPADLDKLIEGLKQLDVRKGGIGKHEDEHYRIQFATMAPAGYEKVFLAEKDGEVLASTLIALFGREASYLHAASVDNHRELRAPRTLLIQVMLYCQEHYPEIERFNFWGVVSDKNRKPSHPRHGYSEFKRGFGGYKEEYIRARDFVYNYPAWRAEWTVAKYRTWKHKND